MWSEKDLLYTNLGVLSCESLLDADVGVDAGDDEADETATEDGNCDGLGAANFGVGSPC